VGGKVPRSARQAIAAVAMRRISKDGVVVKAELRLSALGAELKIDFDCDIDLFFILLSPTAPREGAAGGISWVFGPSVASDSPSKNQGGSLIHLFEHVEGCVSHTLIAHDVSFRSCL